MYVQPPGSFRLGYMYMERPKWSCFIYNMIDLSFAWTGWRCRIYEKPDHQSDRLHHPNLGSIAYVQEVLDLNISAHLSIGHPHHLLPYSYFRCLLFPFFDMSPSSITFCSFTRLVHRLRPPTELWNIHLKRKSYWLWYNDTPTSY